MNYFPQHQGKPAPAKKASAAPVKNVKGPAPGPAVYANQQQK